MKQKILMLLFLGSFVGYAQQTILVEKSSSNTLATSSASNRDINLPKETKGSPYIQKNYFYAFIDDLDKPFKMRYNAFSDQMEFERDGVIYDLDKTQYQLINFDELGKKYVIVEYSDRNKKDFGYLVELSDGKFKLYKKEKIEFVESKKSGTGFGIDSPPEYKNKKDEFFMKLPDGSINSIPNSKGKIIDLLNVDSKSVNNFFKENKISLSSENDLIQLLNFLNTLNSTGK